MKAKKGCINFECKSYQKKIKYKDGIIACPVCGSQLEYVCSKCYKRLPNGDNKLCTRCQAVADDDKDRAIEVAKKAGVAAVAVAGFAAGGIKLIKKFKKI